MAKGPLPAHHTCLRTQARARCATRASGVARPQFSSMARRIEVNPGPDDPFIDLDLRGVFIILVPRIFFEPKSRGSSSASAAVY